MAAVEVAVRSTIQAEWSPTIDALAAQIPVAETRGREAAIVGLQPTIAVLETAIAGYQSYAQLSGQLVDRQGNPINDVLVTIRNGPGTKTDVNGRFVLGNVPIGEQIVVIEPPSGQGQLTQNVSIKQDQINYVNIVYDATRSQLGLLSITSPIDGGLVEIDGELGEDGSIFRTVIYGRSDGLAQLFDDTFDIWILVSSEEDPLLWVQQPPALIDFSASTWKATVQLGSFEKPPHDGQYWEIVVVAVAFGSGMERILNTPGLSPLPPHISSNVVTFEVEISP